MKTKSNINLIVTGLILCIFTVDLSAQFDFYDVTRQPVFSYGDPGEWDDEQVWFPAVIKDGDTLRMWYTGSDKIVWEATKWKIGYAWSLDGIEWNRYDGNPVLSADLPWEGGYLAGCVVINDADTLKMWYGANGPPNVIGYATSVDGKTWNKHPVPVLHLGPALDWDDALIVPWTVIKEADEYKMWYYAGRPGFPQLQSLPQTGMATSPDGIEWTKYDDPETQNAPYANSDPVFKVGETGEWDSHRVIDPMILKTDSGYEMWYAGLKGPISTSTKQQIGYATSEDGIVWERHPDNPVFTDPTAWGRGLYGGTVLKYDEIHHLWFACFHSLTTMASPQIGYARQNVSCLPEGIEFATQAEIDSFSINYPNCTEIEGDVQINGEGINNLNGLNVLTSIEGKLYIVNTDLLMDLSGLYNLTSIGNGLLLSSNKSLLNLTGLNNVTSIDGWSLFENNDSLKSLTGLEGLTSIESLDINRNPSLSSLEGLNNIINIDDRLGIDENSSLQSLSALDNLSYVGGSLWISSNNKLVNLSGLDNLTSVGEDLGIGGYDQDAIPGGEIHCKGNATLIDITSLSNLTYIGGYLGIFCNDSLTNLSGLESLTTIGGGLKIGYADGWDNLAGNTFLTSITGLEAVSSIEGDIQIQGNVSITSLTGLENIEPTSIENIKIKYNDYLSVCDVQSICDYLVAPNGTVEIHNNALGCNSQEEVEQACDSASSVHESNIIQGVSIHPNPFNQTATIEYELKQPSKVQITIYNHLGKQLEVIQQTQSAGKQQVVWNAEGLPSGVYFCVLKTDPAYAGQTLKMIKLK